MTQTSLSGLQQACLLLLLIVGLMLLGPIWGGNPDVMNPDLPTAWPSWEHWMGTDEMGRDLLARLGMGARISLLIGLATACVSVCMGTAVGILAAFNEGRLLDTLLMRLIDVIYSLPGLMIVILFVLFLGRGLPSLVMALSLFSWPDTARIIRGQVLQLQREEFVEAFRSMGGNAWRMAWTQILPNLKAFMLLSATITVPRAILTESTLSFVGLGVAPPLSSWGVMMNDGWQMIRIAPHLLLLPGILLLVTMGALHMLAEALKESAR
jgi:ABC-type dipeptide/oligopeptide/nickel transport system permease subunit